MYQQVNSLNTSLTLILRNCLLPTFYCYMALVLQEPHHLPSLSTMSSQSNLSSILRTSTASSEHHNHSHSSFKFGQTTKIAVGKDNVQLEIMTMAPPSEEQFMCSTCFENLVNRRTSLQLN